MSLNNSIRTINYVLEDQMGNEGIGSYIHFNYKNEGAFFRNSTIDELIDALIEYKVKNKI